MSHCIEYRCSVLDFCGKVGNSIRKASLVFGLSTNTITRWKRWGKERKPKGQTVRKNRKLDLDSLKALLDSSPDLLQSEMAIHFGVREDTVSRGLKKIGYKRKKTTLYKERNEQKRHIWAK